MPWRPDCASARKPPCIFSLSARTGRISSSASQIGSNRLTNKPPYRHPRREGVLAEFLHRYARLFPAVPGEIAGGAWMGRDAGFARAVTFTSRRASAMQCRDMISASRVSTSCLSSCSWHFSPGWRWHAGTMWEVRRLAKYPLLVLDTNYANRRMFDAACRLAGLEPTIAFESRTPHTLVAMAESGRGLAVIPSTMRFRSDRLQVAHLTFQKKRLSEPLAVFWDRRRPLPRYAIAFCRALADHTRASRPR
jgi:DNA-binding transcriptional LysR family regulator